MSFVIGLWALIENIKLKFINMTENVNCPENNSAFGLIGTKVGYVSSVWV